MTMKRVCNKLFVWGSAKSVIAFYFRCVVGGGDILLVGFGDC